MAFRVSSMALTVVFDGFRYPLNHCDTLDSCTPKAWANARLVIPRDFSSFAISWTVIIVGLVVL